jgi:alkaline phosphatase D
MLGGIRLFEAKFLFAVFFIALWLSPSLCSTVIQFGSCNKQERLNSSASIFSSIAAVSSDVFIWLGDVIYTDHHQLFSFFRAADIHSVRQQYSSWKHTEANSKLEKSAKMVMGVWDDHDFGINDGGSEHVHKEETQQIFLDFLGVSSDSHRRKRQGIYSSEVFGQDGKRVRIILLDARYHRDHIDSNGTLLGSEQWSWLESQLRSEIKADLTVIGSGIQVLNDWRPSENWGRFPSQRKRLLQLLSDTNTSGVMFVSGDVHFAEFTEINCSGGRKLIDFTSSGMSHSFDEEVPRFVRPLVLPSNKNFRQPNKLTLSHRNILSTLPTDQIVIYT